MFRAFAVLLTVALLAACGSDSPTEPRAAGVAGVYAMTRANGEVLPYKVTDTWITSGSLELTADRRWTWTLTREVEVDGARHSDTEHQSGTYELTGTTGLRLIYEEGGTQVATFEGDRIQMPSRPVRFTFER